MPKLQPIPHSKYWLLVEDWNYIALDGTSYTVPAGYITDLDTVPRIPFIYSLFKGRYKAASLLHDYLYDGHVIKEEADRLFLECMLREKLNPESALEEYLIIKPMCLATKYLGYSWYNYIGFSFKFLGKNYYKRRVK